MSPVVKIGLITAIIGGAIYALKTASNKALEWAKSVTFQVTGFQMPGVINGKLVMPITVNVGNGSPLTININKVLIKLSVLRSGNYYPFGEITNGGFALQPGVSLQTFYPVIDLKKLGLFTVGNITSDILSVIGSKNPLLDVKIETIVTVEGYALPAQGVVKQLYLKQLLALAA